ncbi:mitochondrial protein Pet127-domain-containing protein [Fennellomyces sp. T-0311]|nr:mitochondrial protein Pet127-domain-containing protein [Fennellomyces sp. T-0311]
MFMKWRIPLGIRQCSILPSRREQSCGYRTRSTRLSTILKEKLTALEARNAAAAAAATAGEKPLDSNAETLSIGDSVIVAKSDMRMRKYAGPASQWRKIDRSIRYQKLKSPEQPEVARLAHGLDRVLFNPGVHYLKDPRTQKYNFTPFLEYITQPTEFDYDMLAPYITSSKDENLMDMARGMDIRYIGSTSSCSGALSQVYFLLSRFKPLDTSVLSSTFSAMSSKFTRGTRTPASINLRWKDGVYAIDADKSLDVGETILSAMGKSMEKVLTLEPAEYERYLKDADSPVPEVERNQPEAYAFGKIGHLLLRSQLDCQHPGLPRKTFDLKTRAAVPVRLDMQNYKDYLGYSLRRSHGLYESFEREYYDMLRSVFLKYSFQVRIGHMDGILVAYHNTRKMFGFQYISREEMDARVFGSSKMANESFRNVLILFHAVLDEVTAKYPNKSLRLSFDSSPRAMNIFVEQEPDSHETQNVEESTDEFFQTKNTIYEPHDQLTLYSLTTQSFVNGTMVEYGEPVVLQKPSDNWTVRYKLTEIQGVDEETKARYKIMRRRQAQVYGRQKAIHPSLANLLKSMSQRGLEKENVKR